MILCEICGKNEATDTHHLIFGRGLRPLADADGQTIEICRQCHNIIHNNQVAMHLSKMVGQAQWEKEYINKYYGGTPEADEARQAFRMRYGRSYL